MKKGLMILVALSIAFLMSASMLVAQEKAATEREMGSCMKEMKLTDEQKAKIEEIKTNFHMTMIDLKAERAKLCILLKKEMMKPEPAMKDIEGIVKKMSAVREKIQLAGIGHMLAMRKLLGTEACKGMRCGMGMGCGRAGMRGMSCCEEDNDCSMMCGQGPGMGEGCGGAGMKGRGAGMKGGCMMGKDGAAGCPMEGAGKKIECKMEIKEEAKKK
ncbi:MAG: hypothetical protein NTW97_01120 [Candidatus Krumholzibacteria bacterium]|nr:hypothetical protein [Candidatus Krumholzibacteria bacterium]